MCVLSLPFASEFEQKTKRKFVTRNGKHVVTLGRLGLVKWHINHRSLSNTNTKLEVVVFHSYLVKGVLRAILNKSWRQHLTRHQLYGHLLPITKIIQVRRTRHAGHCWRSRDELIRDVLLWTPTYNRAKAGRPVRTYIQQLCEDTGCSPEDLPEANEQ